MQVYCSSCRLATPKHIPLCVLPHPPAPHVPMIQLFPCRILSLSKTELKIKPFDIFEFALTAIVTLEDWGCLDELVVLIMQYYKEENIPFCLEFFKKPIYNINGFIAAKYGGELLIFFFALDDDEEGDENFKEIN